MIDSKSAGPSVPTSREELAEVFRSAEKPETAFRIGVESEKFGVHEKTSAPLDYEGSDGVCGIFGHLERAHGWEPFREREGGPILGLKKNGASITLEPGAQLELSGAALRTIDEVEREQRAHFEELSVISRELDVSWLMLGFHPLARLDELPWVPKERYPIMREYLPTRGHAALDMMKRTATVQANFDWSSEADALDKMRVGLALSPFVQALFTNAPFREGAISGRASERGDVWLHMDPSRSGLVRRIWEAPRASYDDYVEWSLDAGMFLFRRGDRFVKNTGQTFREFLAHGFEGERATLDDYRLHLTTLFPEVRLKNTLEVRSADSLPLDLLLSLVAVWTGVFYDERALAEARAFVEAWSFDAVEAERPELVRRGLHGTFLGRDGFTLGERLLEIARGGLERRAATRGVDEARYLGPIEALVERRLHPSDELRERVLAGESIVRAARYPLE